MQALWCCGGRRWPVVRSFFSASPGCSVRIPDVELGEESLSRQQFASAILRFKSALDVLTYAPDVLLRNRVRSRLADTYLAMGQFEKEASERNQVVSELVKDSAVDRAAQSGAVFSFVGSLIRSNKLDGAVAACQHFRPLIDGNTLPPSTESAHLGVAQLQLLHAAARLLLRDPQCLDQLLEVQPCVEAFPSSLVAHSKLLLEGIWHDRIKLDTKAAVNIFTKASTLVSTSSLDPTLADMMLAETHIKTGCFDQALTRLLYVLKTREVKVSSVAPLASCNEFYTNNEITYFAERLPDGAFPPRHC